MVEFGNKKSYEGCSSASSISQPDGQQCKAMRRAQRKVMPKPLSPIARITRLRKMRGPETSILLWLAHRVK
jgi:hypothetical protein